MEFKTKRIGLIIFGIAFSIVGIIMASLIMLLGNTVAGSVIGAVTLTIGITITSYKSVVTINKENKHIHAKRSILFWTLQKVYHIREFNSVKVATRIREGGGVMRTYYGVEICGNKKIAIPYESENAEEILTQAREVAQYLNISLDENIK